MFTYYFYGRENIFNCVLKSYINRILRDDLHCFIFMKENYSYNTIKSYDWEHYWILKICFHLYPLSLSLSRFLSHLSRSLSLVYLGGFTRKSKSRNQSRNDIEKKRGERGNDDGFQPPVGRSCWKPQNLKSKSRMLCIR